MGHFLHLMLAHEVKGHSVGVHFHRNLTTWTLAGLTYARLIILRFLGLWLIKLFDCVFLV